MGRVADHGTLVPARTLTLIRSKALLSSGETAATSDARKRGDWKKVAGSGKDTRTTCKSRSKGEHIGTIASKPDSFYFREETYVSGKPELELSSKKPSL